MLNLRDIPVANFPDGHKHLIVPDDFQLPPGDTIRASLRCFDDIFLLAQAKQIFPELKKLYINYLLAARCDRQFSKGEALDLDIVANAINRLEFDEVSVLRPHSKVASDRINRMKEVDLTPCLIAECEKENNLAIIETQSPAHGLVIPDKGAAEWVGQFASTTRIPIQCTKERDMSSDHRDISKIVVPELPKGITDYIIVDDLCDGGGTFKAISGILKDRGAARVFLVVTHAILSRGVDNIIDPSNFIDKIYCTNSFSDFQNEKIYQINVQ